MATWNGYCTLAELKAYLKPTGQALTVDSGEDAMIEGLIETASRRVEILTGHLFYPRIETYYYDVPLSRILLFGDDLLEIITLTNGDGNTIASTEYKFIPANIYPKSALILTDISSTFWQTGTNSSSQQVISLQAYWGYREKYSMRGWKSAGTLGAAMTTTTGLTYTMTAGHTLEPGGGQIVKIDNELMQSASSAATSLVVVARGDNGSTAATHTNGTAVYVWQHQADINELAIEVTNMMYKSRHGQNAESVSTITAGGVVVTPRSLPIWAQEVIARYKRRV